MSRSAVATGSVPTGSEVATHHAGPLSLTAPAGGEPHGEHVRFPKNFLWGSATAGHQVEGGNHFSDWRQWEQLVLAVELSLRREAHRV